MGLGIYYTGGSLNFARSLGPAAVNHHFPGYFWIYFVGPLLGSLLASAFYGLLNSMRYQTCNPGQDFSGPAEEAGEKQQSLGGLNRGAETPPKAPQHQRNVSGATAVNHDLSVNNQTPVANHDFVVNNQMSQGDVAPMNDTTNLQPVLRE